MQNKEESKTNPYKITIQELREQYDLHHGDDKSNPNRYYTMGNKMHDKTRDREYLKALHNDDLETKISRLKEIIKMPEIEIYEADEDENHFIRKQKDGFFYGAWEVKASLRAYEITLVVQNILKEVEQEINNDFYTGICFLIDKQFTWHRNVLSDKEDDLTFRDEYNNLIWDILEKKRFEIKEMLDIDVNEAPLNKSNKTNLTQKQIILLCRYLEELKVFTPIKIHQDATNQALFIGLLFDLEPTSNIANWNFYKFWRDSQTKDYDKSKIKTKHNLTKLLQYVEKSNFTELTDIIKRDLKDIS